MGGSGAVAAPSDIAGLICHASANWFPITTMRELAVCRMLRRFPVLFCGVRSNPPLNDPSLRSCSSAGARAMFRPIQRQFHKAVTQQALPDVFGPCGCRGAAPSELSNCV